MQQLRLLQQHRTATGFVDGLGRAAEVEVDSRCPERAGKGGIVRQADRVRTQQLNAHRCARASERTVLQLRGELAEAALRQ